MRPTRRWAVAVGSTERFIERRKLGGAKTGEVKLTSAYRLPARFVAHAVGPVWQGGADDEDALLASCYRRALELTVERGCASIALETIRAFLAVDSIVLVRKTTTGEVYP